MKFASVGDPGPSGPAGQSVQRRRTIARANHEPHKPSATTLLKSGICPKCMKKIGRGVRLHSQACGV